MGKSVVSVCLIALPLAAADAESVIRATFVKQWIEAVRSNDPANIRRRFHPKVLACVNPQSSEYFDYVFKADLRYHSKADYRVAKVARLAGPAPLPLLPADGFYYPVQPAYEVDIDFDNATVIRYLAESNGSWYEVQPCPNEKGVAFFHQQLAQGREQKERAARLLEELKDPLRTELITLLHEQRKLDAVRKYQAATGEDLTTAMAVMDLLEPPR